MNNVNNLRIRYFLAFMMAAMLGYGSPTIAADGADEVQTYPPGLACPSFGLQIDIWYGKQHVKQFNDKNGNLVRAISAGTGSTLRYTNLSSGQTFSSKSNGAATETTYNLDRTPSGLTLRGHNVVILFPTDIPAGPSTTLYDGGRVVISIDAGGNFTVQEESGNKTNICAAVSQ